MDCANDSLTGSRPRIAVAMSGVKVGLGRHVCWYVSCELVGGTGAWALRRSERRWGCQKKALIQSAGLPDHAQTFYHL